MPASSLDAPLEAMHDQWLFTLEDFAQTPSVLDGMSMKQERDNRAKGVHFLTQVGIMLKVPQTTLSTAALFLHRFFMRHSMVDQPGQTSYHYYVSGIPLISLGAGTVGFDDDADIGGYLLRLLERRLSSLLRRSKSIVER